MQPEMAELPRKYSMSKFESSFRFSREKHEAALRSRHVAAKTIRYPAIGNSKARTMARPVRFAPFASTDFRREVSKRRSDAAPSKVSPRSRAEAALQLLDANQDLSPRASFRRLDDRGSRLLSKRASERASRRLCARLSTLPPDPNGS